MTTTLSHMEARRVGAPAMIGAIAAAMLSVSQARADGLSFVGDLPDSPHVLIQLTEAQLEQIRRAADAGELRPEILLTAPQRDELRSRTGQDVRWVFAASRKALEGDCMCGTYNLGVLVGNRLAVLTMGLGDHLGTADIVATESALTDSRLRIESSGPAPATVSYLWSAGDPSPDPLRALVARFPGEGFDTVLELPRGWTVEEVRLAELPRVDAEGQLDATSLRWASAISARPRPGSAVRWPELGARLEVDGRVYLLVPGIAEGEEGPTVRAWVLLEYADERLMAAVATFGPWSGTVVDWR